MTASAGQRASNAGAKPPRVSSLRLIGRSAAQTRGVITAPFGASFTADAKAYAVALDATEASDLVTVTRALPDPAQLAEGALVFVLPLVVEAPSFRSSVLAVFGRGRAMTRELRSTALVARGYVGVSAGVDHVSRVELVWGYAPGPSPEA